MKSDDERSMKVGDDFDNESREMRCASQFNASYELDRLVESQMQDTEVQTNIRWTIDHIPHHPVRSKEIQDYINGRYTAKKVHAHDDNSEASAIEPENLPFSQFMPKYE